MGVVATVLAGCVVEGALDPDGGARLRVRYRLVSVAHLDPGKASFESPDVTVTSATMTPEKWATFDLTVADVRRLSSAPAFAGTTVTLADEPGGERTLTVAVAGNPDGRLPPPYVAYLGSEGRVALTLPGAVVRSNATAVDGRIATWVFPLVAEGQPARTFSVTYRPAPS